MWTESTRRRAPRSRADLSGAGEELPRSSSPIPRGEEVVSPMRREYVWTALSRDSGSVLHREPGWETAAEFREGAGGLNLDRPGRIAGVVRERLSTSSRCRPGPCHGSAVSGVLVVCITDRQAVGTLPRASFGIPRSCHRRSVRDVADRWIGSEDGSSRSGWVNAY